LEVRKAVALDLVRRGQLDPYEALALVCWPPQGSKLEQAPTGEQHYGEEVKDEVRRHQQGETIAQLVAKTGIPHATIKCFVSTADRARSARKLARPSSPPRGDPAAEEVSHGPGEIGLRAGESGPQAVPLAGFTTAATGKRDGRCAGSRLVPFTSSSA